MDMNCAVDHHGQPCPGWHINSGTANPGWVTFCGKCSCVPCICSVAKKKLYQIVVPPHQSLNTEFGWLTNPTDNFVLFEIGEMK